VGLGGKETMYRKVGILLVAVGALIIMWALYARWDTAQRQKVMIKEFNEIADSYVSQGNKESQESQENDKKPLDVKLSAKVLGIISIPKIDLKVSIVEGIDDASLKYAVGHFKETAKPGEKGNCAIAGHRSYTYNKFFNRLNEMETGDEILIKTQKGEFKYIVYEKKIVLPTDTSVLNSVEDTVITLITCHPERSSDYRMVVKGKLER
jgi:sortase A